jgi:hypothetical protein
MDRLGVTWVPPRPVEVWRHLVDDSDLGRLILAAEAARRAVQAGPS